MKSKVAPRVTAAKVAQDFIGDPQGLPGRTVENALEMIARETGIVFSDEAISIGFDQTNRKWRSFGINEKRTFSKASEFGSYVPQEIL
jgi:hypothetical protein